MQPVVAPLPTDLLGLCPKLEGWNQASATEASIILYLFSSVVEKKETVGWLT